MEHTGNDTVCSVLNVYLYLNRFVTITKYIFLFRILFFNLSLFFSEMYLFVKHRYCNCNWRVSFAISRRCMIILTLDNEIIHVALSVSNSHKRNQPMPSFSLTLWCNKYTPILPCKAKRAELFTLQVSRYFALQGIIIPCLESLSLTNLKQKCRLILNRQIKPVPVPFFACEATKPSFIDLYNHQTPHF